MPDDVGGRPFQDGRDPENSDDRGGAKDDFATVVFDEDFVRAAAVHEPTAVERLLAAAQARAEAEAARARAGGRPGDDDPYGDGYDPSDPFGGRYGDAYDPNDPDGDSSPYGPHGGALRPYRGSARWHRPVAWVLALVMGVGMVALAFTAVYRGASANRQDQVPAPATTGIDEPRGNPPAATAPSASAEYSPAPVHAVPRTP
ncbi:SCO2584 family spore wall biosynthesis protein [Streptomyces sp. NPDC054975]